MRAAPHGNQAPPRGPGRPPGSAIRRPLLLGGAVLLLAAGIVYMLLGRGTGRFRGATGDASILLITIDTLRADHLGAYGHREIRTPVIDTLADEGVLFENAITPAIMTLPSHASILTGTYPPTHGIRDNGDYRLNQNALTLADALRARGFRTGAAVGSFVLDSMFGLDQGFEQYDDALPARRPNETFLAERPAASVTDAALRFLNHAKGSRFFLWVHYFDPHQPYAAPSPFREQYPGRSYDAEIAYVDSEIGRLLAAVKQMGARERTLIVLTADHGEGLGDHGEETHGVFIYEEETRVPLILSFPPHLPARRRVKAVVRTVDIMPTILDLVRIDPREAAAPVQGETLWPFMAAGGAAAGPGRPAYAEAMAPLLLYGWSPLTSIRDDRYKYIDAPKPELYDLKADPGERSNLAASRSEVAAGYRARLEALIQAVTRTGAGAEAISPDPEAQARLRSLGYAVSGGARTAAAGGPASLPDPKEMVGMLARINSVYTAFGAGQHDLAAREARAILAGSPDNAHVRFYLAGALTESGRHEEALREYKLLLDRSPKDTEAMSNMGWCLMNMQRFDEATALFRRVLEIFPNHIHAQANLANIAFVKGDFRDAIRQYKQLLQIEPNHIPAIMALAGIYEATGKLDEAGIVYAHGVEVDARSIELWMSLGWIRFQQGRHDDALEALQRAQSLAPQAPEVQVALGDVLLAMGRLEEARAAYQKGVDVAPGLAPGWYGLSLIESRQGDPAKALDLIQKAVSLSPEKVAWREDLGRVLAGNGRYAAAAEELERYLASGQAPPERREDLRREIQRYRRGSR